LVKSNKILLRKIIRIFVIN